MSRTKVKDYEGVEVWLTERGKFTATVGQATIERAKLSELEREIGKRTGKKWKPVLCMTDGRYSDAGPRIYRVVDFKPRAWGGGIENLRHENGDVIAMAYRYDEALMKDLVAFQEADLAHTERRRALMDRLQHVQVSDFIPANAEDDDAAPTE